MADDFKISKVYKYAKNEIKKVKDGHIQTAPIYVTSKPGMGKSQLVIGLSKEFNCPLFDARLAQFAPEDLRGVPYPNAKDRTTEWFTPALFPRKNELCILFLDELDKAKPAVQNAALQLLLERRLGEYTLPDKVVMIAAGNTINDNSFSIPLSSALNNRLLHIEMDVDAKDWIKWASQDVIINKKTTSRIEEDIIGFINMKPSMLHSFSEKNRAWPSPRTWEMFSNLIRSYKNPTDNELIDLGSMAVGMGSSREFYAYRKIYKKIDVKKILKGDYPKLDTSNASYTYAMCSCLGFYVKNNGLKDKKEVQNCLGFLKKLSDEFKIVALTIMLMRNQLTSKINTLCPKETEEVVNPVLDAIG